MFFFTSVFLFLCQSISKAQFSIKFSRLRYFHKWTHSSEKALRDHKEHLLLYPLSTTKPSLTPRRTCAAYAHRPAPWTWRQPGKLTPHTSTPKATFSGMCAQTLPLHFEERRVPRSPSSVSAALPQLRPRSRSLCHGAACVWKPVIRAGSHQELAVGVFRQRKMSPFSMLIACLWSPKRAARRQLHHADCFALLIFFSSPFFSKHIIYCAWGSLLSVYLSVISSFWEQLDWYTLNGKAAHLLSKKSRQRKGTCRGQGVQPGSGMQWWHPSVPPPPPCTAWTFCAAAGCPGCHRE